MDSETLEELIKNDNVEELCKIDIFFNECWTERAVEHKAYKCLLHLLDKGTTLSQFCFIRAAENNDINFCIKYKDKLDIKQTYYDVIEATYNNDNFELFRKLLDMFPDELKSYRKFAKHLLSDVSLSFKDNDYVGELYSKVKHAFRTKELLEHFREKNNYGSIKLYIGKEALRDAIEKGIKLPLDNCRFTRRLYIGRNVMRDHRDMLRYYSSRVAFARRRVR
jgi:hypothetical protein